MSESRVPRRARLYVSRVDPWSVTKAAFILALAVGVVIVVAVAMLWWALDATGVFMTISRTTNDVVGSAATGFDLMQYLSFSKVIGVTTVVASVEIILVSVFSALFAMMYNLTVGLTGGLEVVLSDDV